MPIKIPDLLPAREILENENIFVMSEKRAMSQDIRPLKILILNLMPTKIATETQLLRKLSNSPLQAEIEFLEMASHSAKNTNRSHLDTFYTTLDNIKNRRFDGMIITGAPVELLDFRDVDYWDELCEVFEWSKTNVHCTLHICWGAQAALYYHFGVGKREIGEKLSGVFPNKVVKETSPLVRGFDNVFMAPHSRYTESSEDEINRAPNLEIIASSDRAGVYLAKSTDSRMFFVMGHPEYDWDTLKNEYERDVKAGINPKVPENYFVNDDPSSGVKVSWRAHAQLLYTNWLNYYVYQTTPYDIENVGRYESLDSSGL